MKILALMTAILLLKAARCIAWTSESIADGALWIIDQCDPATRGR